LLASDLFRAKPLKIAKRAATPIAITAARAIAADRPPSVRTQPLDTQFCQRPE